MKKIKNFILMLLTFTIIFVSIPVSSVNASNDYLTSFTVSKKVIYKGNGVSVSVDKAKKGSRNVEITFQTVDKVLRETSVSRSIFLCVYEIYSENRKFSLGLCHP